MLDTYVKVFGLVRTWKPTVSVVGFGPEPFAGTCLPTLVAALHFSPLSKKLSKVWREQDHQHWPSFA